MQASGTVREVSEPIPGEPDAPCPPNVEAALREKEERASRSESQLRLITDAIPAFIAYVDRDLRYVRVNRRYEEWLGRPASEILGRTVDEVLVKESADTIRPHLLEAIQGTPQFFETRLHTIHDVRLIRVTHVPDVDNDGYVRGVVVHGIDVTDRHQAETALAQSEQRFRQLSNSSPAGVFQANLEGNIIYVNPLARKIFDIYEDEIPVSLWFSRVHPDDADRIATDWPAMNAQGLPYQTEYRLAMPSGEIRHIAARSNVLFDESGRPCGVVGTIDDITDRIRTEDALLRNEKLAAVGRLASSIAHEINNPLTSVTNLLYLAGHTDEIASIHEYLRTAERELRRVAVITNQTLRFHKQSSSPRAVTFEELIENLLVVYQGRLVNSRVRIETRNRARRPVLCFEGEIRQVISNLVSNAIDAIAASPEGGKLYIRSHEAINWKTGERSLVITVADTGTGMSARTQQKLFDAFFTTKGIGGTGLGLWVSKEIVERHRGTIVVRSSEEPQHHGSVFRFFLPFAAHTRA